MALEAQNNPFTSVLMVEAADVEALPDADPSAGSQRLAVGTDHLLYLVNSSGTKTAVGGAGGAMATDALWDAAGDLAVGTGANTGAKLSAGSAGAVLAMGNSGVIWNAGTSFPGSKATNDRYWRTDLHMEFYWDGTRWLSSQLFIMSAMSAPTALPITANTGFWLSSFGQSTNSIYVVDFRGATYVVTTNTGSLFWTVRLADIGSTTVGSATFTTAADTPDVLTSHIVAVNTVVTTPSLFQIVTTKTSTPGNMYLAMFATYRIIAT
jgi:hypothetical protein